MQESARNAPGHSQGLWRGGCAIQRRFRPVMLM